MRTLLLYSEQAHVESNNFRTLGSTSQFIICIDVLTMAFEWCIFICKCHELNCAIAEQEDKHFQRIYGSEIFNLLLVSFIAMFIDPEKCLHHQPRLASRWRYVQRHPAHSNVLGLLTMNKTRRSGATKYLLSIAAVTKQSCRINFRLWSSYVAKTFLHCIASFNGWNIVATPYL